MHSCEHIINRTMVRILGCGRSISAHIEKKKSKLDYILDCEPSDAQIQDIENKVNEVISQNLDITEEFITQAEAAGRFDLKRLPEDASDTVRIVKIGDYDECLCLGSHVSNTREIGRCHFISHDWDPEMKRLRIRYKLDQPESGA